MESTWIGYSLVVGLWLAIADWAAIEIAQHHGRRPGLVVWVVAALLPLLVTLYLSPKVGLGAAVVGAMLSGMAYWLHQQAKKEERGEPVHWLNRLL